MINVYLRGNIVATDTLLQRALRAVVVEIRGLSAESLKRELAKSQESEFAKTVDALMGFYEESLFFFHESLLSNSHGFKDIGKIWAQIFPMTTIELSPANDSEYLIAA
jgi:hypothetical protein